MKLVVALREVSAEIELFVDALWRLNESQAIKISRELASLDVGWLEAPFMPEEFNKHARLRSLGILPIAIGESYRGRSEFERIFAEDCADVLQPDLGRCGISTSSWVVQTAYSQGLRFAPHVSISLGPQLAAALHISASTPALVRTEVNPQILAVAQNFIETPLQVDRAHFVIPDAPGLGISVTEALIEPYIAAKVTVS